MKNKTFTLLALIVLLFGCKKSDNSYHLHYEEEGCEYDYYIDDFDGLDYETVERYAAFDIAHDYRSIVALMDSLIDTGTHLRSWSNIYYDALKKTLPRDSLLPRLQKLLKREPSIIYDYWELGRAYHNLENDQKTIEYYRNGLTSLQRGDTALAVNSLTEALELAKRRDKECRTKLIQSMLDSIASGSPISIETFSDTLPNN